METRAITFRKLKDICSDVYCRGTAWLCLHKDLPYDYGKCTAANCPVWRKLKVVK